MKRSEYLLGLERAARGEDIAYVFTSQTAYGRVGQAALLFKVTGAEHLVGVPGPANSIPMQPGHLEYTRPMLPLEASDRLHELQQGTSNVEQLPV